MTLACAHVQVPYGGMAGLPGGMPGYPGMYHQPQAYPYMAPYSLNAPYLGGMHPGFAAYPQACPWPCLCCGSPADLAPLIIRQ